MNIQVSTIKVYKLRDIGDCGWADIAIDPSENGGRISIASDWGSWQKYWGSCGSDFEKFLIGLRNNMDYVAGKMQADNFFDFEGTINALKSRVLEYRRRDEIEKNKARLIYNEIKSIEDEGYPSRNSFLEDYYQTENLSRWHYEVETVDTVSPQFRNFWNKAFLPFLDYLQAKDKWQPYEHEDCPDCGGALEVFSEGDTVSDGAPVRCMETGCQFKSAISIENGESWIQHVNV